MCRFSIIVDVHMLRQYILWSVSCLDIKLGYIKEYRGNKVIDMSSDILFPVGKKKRHPQKSHNCHTMVFMCSICCRAILLPIYNCVSSTTPIKDVIFNVLKLVQVRSTMSCSIKLFDGIKTFRVLFVRTYYVNECTVHAGLILGYILFVCVLLFVEVLSKAKNTVTTLTIFNQTL